ncbi:hypothetical protein AB0P19_06865 [Microbacterium oleivorans]|uniref:hypothetical protein n=1 Tax=Microbacterium oleivorans TaxID=273677 RepID=UPI0033F9FA90
MDQQNTWNAAIYDVMQHAPDHAYVVASYAAFKRVMMQQWRELRQGGIQFIASLDDPYSNSQEMFEQVLKRHELRVYADNGAGLPEDHPMKEPVDSGVQGFLVYNDVFRGVHDIMGHIVSGGSFGPNGEEKAWRAHRQTMPPLAHNALWCETRGQNAWTNFAHNHSELPLPERPFGEQKVGLVPSFIAS